MSFPIAASGGITSLLLCFAGLSGLCISMERHRRQVSKRDRSNRISTLYRCSGWLLLSLSFVASVLEWGTSVGIVMWLGIFSLSTAIIVVSLPYAPRVFAACAMLAVPAGVFMIAAQVWR